MILLVSDIENLRADTQGPAHGLIIEAHMEQGRGPVAEVLITEGTLHTGDYIVAGTAYAKVRNLEDSSNKPITSAGPSMPAVITGFRTLPEFGDEFDVMSNEREARSKITSSERNRQTRTNSGMNSSELIRLINRSNEVQELKVIVKADVQGSLTSVIDSLKSLDTDEVSIRIVGSSVGPINENDIHLAATSKALIYGFNVPMANNVKQLAHRDGVVVHLYRIIYELLDDAKAALTLLLSPEIIENDLGRLVVKGVFKTTRTEIICGGEVTKGKLIAPALARIKRDDEILGEVEVIKLQRGPQETKEVFEGEMCGASLKTSSRIELEEGDRLELFTRQTVARTLQ